MNPSTGNGQQQGIDECNEAERLRGGTDVVRLICTEIHHEWLLNLHIG